MTISASFNNIFQSLHDINLLISFCLAHSTHYSFCQSCSGRGQAIRLILEDQGIPYTDESNITKETWPPLKKTMVSIGLHIFGMQQQAVRPQDVPQGSCRGPGRGIHITPLLFFILVECAI